MTPEDIKAIRAARGMTQAELANALGVTRGHIAKLEAGTQTAKGAIIVALRAISLLGRPDTWPDCITVTQEPAAAQLKEMMDLILTQLPGKTVDQLRQDAKAKIAEWMETQDE